MACWRRRSGSSGRSVDARSSRRDASASRSSLDEDEGGLLVEGGGGAAEQVARGAVAASVDERGGGFGDAAGIGEGFRGKAEAEAQVLIFGPAGGGIMVSSLRLQQPTYQGQRSGTKTNCRPGGMPTRSLRAQALSSRHPALSASLKRDGGRKTPCQRRP